MQLTSSHSNYTQAYKKYEGKSKKGLLIFVPVKVVNQNSMYWLIKGEQLQMFETSFLAKRNEGKFDAN